MKIPHFTKILSAFMVAVIFGVLTLGITSAFGVGESVEVVTVDPSSDTPGIGVSPTFTGINVTGPIVNPSEEVKGTVKVEDKLWVTDRSDFDEGVSFHSGLGSHGITDLYGPDDFTGVALNIHGNSEISGSIRNTSFGDVDPETGLEPALPVKIDDYLKITKGATAESFGQIYYKDSNWISYDGDGQMTSLSCAPGDIVIGCWVNDKDSHLDRLDVRNQFFPSKGMCQVDFNAISSVLMNQSIVCWDPNGDYDGSLYSHSSGTGASAVVTGGGPGIPPGGGSSDHGNGGDVTGGGVPPLIIVDPPIIYLNLPIWQQYVPVWTEGVVLQDLAFFEPEASASDPAPAPRNPLMLFDSQGNNETVMTLSWDLPEGLEESQILGWNVDVFPDNTEMFHCPTGSDANSTCYMESKDVCDYGMYCLGDYGMDLWPAPSITREGIATRFEITALLGDTYYDDDGNIIGVVEASEAERSGTAVLDYVFYECLYTHKPLIKARKSIVGGDYLFWSNNFLIDVCYPNHIINSELAFYDRFDNKIGNSRFYNVNHDQVDTEAVFTHEASWAALFRDYIGYPGTPNVMEQAALVLRGAIAGAAANIKDIVPVTATSAKMRTHYYYDGVGTKISPWSDAFEL